VRALAREPLRARAPHPGTGAGGQGDPALQPAQLAPTAHGSPQKAIPGTIVRSTRTAPVIAAFARFGSKPVRLVVR
jgi:hypothetical protein